jgi:hypothetical protein
MVLCVEFDSSNSGGPWVSPLPGRCPAFEAQVPSRFDGTNIGIELVRRKPVLRITGPSESLSFSILQLSPHSTTSFLERVEHYFSGSFAPLVHRLSLRQTLHPPPKNGGPIRRQDRRRPVLGRLRARVLASAAPSAPSPARRAATTRANPPPADRARCASPAARPAAAAAAAPQRAAAAQVAGRVAAQREQAGAATTAGAPAATSVADGRRLGLDCGWGRESIGQGPGDGDSVDRRYTHIGQRPGCCDELGQCSV